MELIPGASPDFILDRIGGSPLSLEKGESKPGVYTFTPPWSPQQMLQASDINMMQAVTLYWTSGMAGGGTKKDEALRYVQRAAQNTVQFTHYIQYTTSSSNGTFLLHFKSFDPFVTNVVYNT